MRWQTPQWFTVSYGVHGSSLCVCVLFVKVATVDLQARGGVKTNAKASPAFSIAQWRHCATSLQVAGSIPDGVIGIFH